MRRSLPAGERSSGNTNEDIIMSKKKGGAFKGHNAKTGTFAQIPQAPQARRPPGAPVMRIAPRAKASPKGR